MLLRPGGALWRDCAHALGAQEEAAEVAEANYRALAERAHIRYQTARVAMEEPRLVQEFMKVRARPPTQPPLPRDQRSGGLYPDLSASQGVHTHSLSACTSPCAHRPSSTFSPTDRTSCLPCAPSKRCGGPRSRSVRA